MIGQVFKKKNKKHRPQTQKPDPKISATFQAGQSIRAGVFYRVGLRMTPNPTRPAFCSPLYLDAEPKGLSFSILSTSIILQRKMLTLDFLLLRGYARSLNEGIEMVINFKKKKKKFVVLVLHGFSFEFTEYIILLGRMN